MNRRPITSNNMHLQVLRKFEEPESALKWDYAQENAIEWKTVQPMDLASTIPVMPRYLPDSDEDEKP